MNKDLLLTAFDVLNTVLFIAVPVWAVLRLRWIGIAMATLVMWGLLLLIDPAIAACEPGGLWPVIWLVYLYWGWLFSLIYVAIVAGITLLVIALGRKLLRKPRIDSPPASAGTRLGAFRRWEASLYPLERIGLTLLLVYLSVLTLIARDHFPPH